MPARSRPLEAIEDRLNNRSSISSYTVTNSFSTLVHSRTCHSFCTDCCICAAGTAERDARVSTLDSVNVRESKAITDPCAGGQGASGGRVGLLGNRDFMDTPFNTISYTEAYIADRQARDITSVIAAADPTVFTNNASGARSENYSIRGFASSTTDMTVDGMFGMAPF